MPRILVADKLAEEGITALKSAGFEVDVKVGLKEEELAACIGGYCGVVCRSGIKVTSKVLENSGNLKCIARAGVGVDNIDCDAATEKGVLVLNTAEASTLSTAEHALALLLSLARKISQADSHVKSGQWKRAQFQGTQLAGKTLGVVGLGRIGRTVAVRAMAFEMTVIGFDPFFSAETALDGSVQMVRDFDDFLSRVDAITFHVPGGDETHHLLNRERLFSKCKPNLLVINDSRGTVIDEIALAEALKEGKVAGAAIDVFATEPPAKDHPLFALSNTVLTCHLGASTDEAQYAVAVSACEAMVAYISKGEIRGAVNAVGLKLDLPYNEAPFAELAQRIALVAGSLSDGGIKAITLRASGANTTKHISTLLRLASVAILAPHLEAPCNIINVEHRAARRGINLSCVVEPAPPHGLVGDIVGVRVDYQNGASRRVLGTVYADRMPRILRIDECEMDFVAHGSMVLLENLDLPGVISTVGSIFATANLNIADLVLSRQPALVDGVPMALIVVKLDSDPTADVMQQLAANKYIKAAHKLNLPPLPCPLSHPLR
eukprot:NODE_824_length_1838_cov_104.039743_g770_i0.p1 GENE.NODE_824_length_1838_cov_104.039743_g770_i0~~NODE_824_length_1838_cov_104.039743_g770_i0.p1  ORF type:complete len:567 (+),score=118.66 NODE_824_length_1838_cov_104.039743_g770_i0:57-1703(+)